MNNFKKVLIAVSALGLAMTAQAKDISKADWLKKQEKYAAKKGKEIKPAALEKRWTKIDLNSDGMLSKDEVKAAKKSRKTKKD